MVVKIRNTRNKVRINITVDKRNLEQARRKLGLFGGKVSSMFNAYLNDFVKSSEKTPSSGFEELINRVRELEQRLKKVEGEAKKE